MSLPKDKAWFPAKAGGYGWGLPSRWQGWVVLLLYIMALIIGGVFIPKIDPLVFVGYTIVVSLILCGISSWKGERAAWRSGGVEHSSSARNDKA